MSELIFAPLTNFADVTMGQSPGSELCNTEGKGLPFLQGCAEFGARHPQTSVFCDPPLRIAKAGAVLISVRAPVGTMNYADQDYCIGRGLGCFKAKANFSNTVFLKHAVKYNAGYLHRRSQGSTFAAVSTVDVQSVPIPVFHTEKQNKIAEIFTTIDQTIEKTEALIEKYQQIKAGLVHDLFTRGIGADGKLRPPREQAPELYRETQIGWIPEDWSFTDLEQACSCIVDCPHSTPNFLDSGILVARTIHIKDGVFFDEIASRVSEDEYLQRISRAKPQPGDIVFTREAPVGEAFVIPEGMKICLGQRVMLIRPNSSILDSDYLMAQIYSGGLKSRISDLTAGTTNPHLNVADVRGLKIALPSYSEQIEMKSLIKVIYARIRIEQDRLRKFQLKKSGLMHDLLTGKVQVNVNESDTLVKA
jgi:type I restriction enzyme S subunit